MVEAQPTAVLTDAFAAALMRGLAAWPALVFPTVRVIDRQDVVVASATLTGLRVTDDGSAHADPVFLSNYTPGDSLLTVQISSSTLGVVLVLEMAETLVTPAEPFWLTWDARGIFRP
jgi:hypothetical protein